MSGLDREFDAGDRRAARAYAVSAALVRDLVSRYGADLPGRLLTRLDAGDSIERAFFVSTGVPLSEAERAFWRGRWWYQVVPFVTSSLVLWMGIVLLALAAVRRRAATRAERRRRWDEEDALTAAAFATETDPTSPPDATVPDSTGETGTDATRSGRRAPGGPAASLRADA